MVYTVKNRCIEEPEMFYEDGMEKIFLYTRGTQGNPSKELKDMLKYIEKTTSENVTNPDIEVIHKLVNDVKDDKEVGITYMKTWEREQLILEQGIEQGMVKGKTEGENLFVGLMRRLLEDGRNEDIELAVKDEEVRVRLYKEYGF